MTERDNGRSKIIRILWKFLFIYFFAQNCSKQRWSRKKQKKKKKLTMGGKDQALSILKGFLHVCIIWTLSPDMSCWSPGNCCYGQRLYVIISSGPSEDEPVTLSKQRSSKLVLFVSTREFLCFFQKSAPSWMI